MTLTELRTARLEYVKKLESDNKYLESKVAGLNEEIEGLKRLVEKHQNIRRSQGSLV